MGKTTRSSLGILLAATAAFWVGSGCSRDDSVAPPRDWLPDDLSKAVVTGPLGEPTFVETFDQHFNTGNWSFFGNPDNRIEIIEMNGGNPGAFLHARCGVWGCLDTYAPQLRTQLGVASIFTGDYRQKNVTGVGVDIAIFGPEYVTTGGRPLSILLRHDSGTPHDYSDDITVFWAGNKGIPMPTGAFKEFEIPVPSQSATLPMGWGVLSGYGTGDDDADWNRVITGVSQLTFFFGDPEMFFIFQQWEIGVDNVRIWCEE